MNYPIGRQVAEAEQWVREMQTAASKPGRGQELARYRLGVSESIVTTLKWCRDNADELKAYRQFKGQSAG